MSDVIDMSTPVTRGELRDELAQFETRIERKFDDKLDGLERKLDAKIDAKIDGLERKFDDKLDGLERRFDDKLDDLERKLNHNMGLWGEALAAQIRQVAVQISKEVAAQIAESEKRLLGELARHMQAGFESMTAQISAVDDKYKDLPARRARLEAQAFK
jgi:exonuclease VII large subunit